MPIPSGHRAAQEQVYLNVDVQRPGWFRSAQRCAGQNNECIHGWPKREHNAGLRCRSTFSRSIRDKVGPSGTLGNRGKVDGIVSIVPCEVGVSPLVARYNGTSRYRFE